MISSNTEKLIVKFLKKNCYGDFNYVMGYKSRYVTKLVTPVSSNSFENFTPKLHHVLIIMCNFKSFDTFPGYSSLGEKLHQTLGSILNGIDAVSIESNTSTYYCKD